MSQPKKKKKVDKPRSRKTWLWLGGILLLTFLAFLPVLQCEFLNFDDNYYITENPLLQDLNGANVRALFTETYLNQYSPVAMLIMALEIQGFGLDPGALKLFSILLHLGNVALVFFLIRKLFNRIDYGVITAALFAIHPLQVEAVAWLAASMKVGTYSLFSLASLLAYVHFLDKRKAGYLWLSVGFFVLSSFCKEQAAVLPVLLLAIDYLKGRNLLGKEVVLEKIPFFIVAVIFGLFTMTLAGEMRGSGQMLPYSLGQRVIFASYALTSYLFKHLFPVHLSTFYAYPPLNHIPAWYYLTPLVSLGILASLFIWWKKDRRLLVFGMLFFLVNIFLVILSQIFSVRDMIMADRYTYLSAIGFFLILAYGLSNLVEKNPRWKSAVYGVIALYCLVLAGLTYQRAGVWKDSITMFTDAIEKGKSEKPGVFSPSLAVPYNNRGMAKKKKGDREGAMADFNLSIQCNPGYSKPYSNRGVLYFEAGETASAIENYNKTLELDPNSAEDYSNRGAAYGRLGQYELAKKDLNKALSIKPDLIDALSNLSLVMYNENQYEETLALINKVLELSPQNPDFLNFKKLVLSKLDQD